MSIKKLVMILGAVVAVAIVAGILIPKNNQTEQMQTLPPPEVGQINAASGVVISKAEYQQNQAKYDGKKIIYFFKTSWCMACRAVSADISANPGSLPADVVIVEIDFDTDTELKQRYGVEKQTTFVQIDKDGNKLATWQADNVKDLVAGIQ